MNKQTQFKNVMRHTLHEMWSHMERQMMTLPEGEHLNWHELSDKDKRTVDNIKSIEAEWIIDDDLRRQLTMLQTDDDQP